GQLLFFVNSNAHKSSESLIELKGKSVKEFDLESGKITDISFHEKNGKVKFELKLKPLGSSLYFVFDNEYKGNKLENKKKGLHLIDSISKMNIEPDSDNILVLDYLDLKTPDTLIENCHFMKATDHIYMENNVEIGNPWQHKIQYKKNYVELDT